MTAEKKNGFDESLLKVLACPLCYKNLTHNKKDNLLICKGCSQKYPIKDGIPILIPKETKD